MNVKEIIDELRKRELIREMPEGHIVRRKEEEYRHFIKDINLSQEEYEPERFSEDRDIGDLIYIPPFEGVCIDPYLHEAVYIPAGSIEFPEIETQKIEGEIKEEGMEALAWYRSFHWTPPDRWGIYILDKGIYYIAKNVFGKIEIVSREGRRYNTLDLLQESFRLLFLHEFFHYITDIAAAALEIGNLTPHPYYLKYITNVYMQPRNKNEPLEEALANAYAFKRFRGGGMQRDALQFFMRGQPAGYSAFEKYISRRDFRYGMRVLGTSIRNGAHVSERGSAPLEILFDCYRYNINFGDVPVYIVPTIRDPKYSIRLITKIPRSAIVESPTFIKDLQKLPPPIVKKYKKVLRQLEYNVRSTGIKFKKIKGCDTVFTVRISKEYRLSMRPLNGKWELLRIGKHDEIYRNPGKC